MLKWYILSALLSAGVQGDLNQEKPSFVQTKEINSSRAVAFSFSNNIATAVTNSTHVLLNVSKDDSESASVRCVVPLKNDIVGRLKAATSDDAVVVWGVTGGDEKGEDYRLRFGGVLVKPWNNCEATPMTIGSYQSPKEYSPLDPIILFNKGSYRVLPHQRQDCPSYQFRNDDDAFVPTHGARGGNPSTNFLMKVVRLPNGDDGYFYAYNDENNTAVMRYLDVDRTVREERYVDHPIDAADPMKNRTLVNVCFDDGVKVICGQLDDQLKFRFKRRVPLLEGRYVLNLAVSAGPRSGLLVATLQIDFKKPPKYVVYSYDAEGTMVKAMDFGELDMEKVADLDSWYSDEGGRYCLSMHESGIHVDDPGTREVVKCIDVE